MLGDEEGDAALTDTLLILGHHVVAHNLDATTIGPLEELAHDMGLGVEGDAMVHLRVLGEEFLEDAVVLLLFLIEGQIDFGNLDIREVVHHIVAESGLAVGLLL